MANARFVTGLDVAVGIFTNNAYDTVTFAFEGVSPGNAETVDPLWQSARELEDKWNPFEAKLRAA